MILKGEITMDEKYKRIREIRNILSDNGRQCFFTHSEVGRMIGKKKYESTEKFLYGIPAININGRKCYFVGDIAKKIYSSQI